MRQGDEKMNYMILILDVLDINTYINQILISTNFDTLFKILCFSSETPNVRLTFLSMFLIWLKECYACGTNFVNIIALSISA